MTIDAVITWVDGNDPALAEKRRQYGSKADFSRADIAGATRFANIGEIFWCVASINRFAPFINRIYIVTDGQDPHLEPFLEKNFPEGYIPVEVVDHKTIFAGFEQYLPVFNSVAIETMTWRIPGLSEHYIEFNDDLLLTKPVTPSDFFTEDGNPICYAKTSLTAVTRFTRFLKKLRGRLPATYKGVMVNAARLEGFNPTYLHLDHTPKAFLRSINEKWLDSDESRYVRNISHRFRSPDQYILSEVQYLTLRRLGQLTQVPVSKHSGGLFFLQPKPKPGYLDSKIAELQKGDFKFCCLNSVELASPEDLAKILSWIGNLLNINQL